MIITRTPYRVSFFGGGSDYPEWYRNNDGACLAVTINKYCWIAVRPPTPFGPKFKVVYSKVEEVDRLDDIKHPAVRECLREVGLKDQGCEVHHWADLPARSGMGSSSAFVVGLLRALVEMLGSQASDYDNLGIPHWASYIERDVLKETVGDQDQLETFWGGLNLLTFSAWPKWHSACRAVPAGSGGVLAGLNARLMLFYTGEQRTASDVASGYVKEMCADWETMGKIIAMAEQGRHCLKWADYEGFGRLLDEAWRLKRGLKGASSARIDSIYAAARNAGALGGKILGAGGGGFMLLYAEPEIQPAVRAALKDLIEVPFEFEDEGSTIVCEGCR